MKMAFPCIVYIFHLCTLKEKYFHFFLKNGFLFNNNKKKVALPQFFMLTNVYFCSQEGIFVVKKYRIPRGNAKHYLKGGTSFIIQNNCVSLRSGTNGQGPSGPHWRPLVLIGGHWHLWCLLAVK